LTETKKKIKISLKKLIYKYVSMQLRI